MNPNRKIVECKHCQRKTGVAYSVTVLTLDNKPNRVEVMRCMKCDAAECPNPSCDTRTLRPKARNCPGCGINLIPTPR